MRCRAGQKQRSALSRVLILSLVTVCLGTGQDVRADEDQDFGLKVERQLHQKSQRLFGIKKPLQESAVGPFTGPNNPNAVVVAEDLEVTVVSNVTHPQADMIALWPNDHHPTHLFVCVEIFFAGNDPSQVSVQRIDLNQGRNNNVATIVKGISSCDPIKRTPWGTLVVGEESGADGGLYEILDPLGIDAATPVIVSDRATGTTSDPSRVVKRKAVGALSWEGIVILGDGTVYFGDELRPQNGQAGGGIYKFVPTTSHLPSFGHITSLSQSPLVSGTNYGMRLGTRNGNTDYGQGSEIGKGIWLAIDRTTFSDTQGNITLRNAQLALKFTGYYRPEDMDRDPIAAENGIIRMCWANTGRMSHGPNSAVEEAANYGEVLCLTDQPKPSAISGSVPFVTRFVDGDPEANHFDNVTFQPRTGNLVIQEDGETQVLNADGSLKELRGNDIWMCLPDGADRDVLSDGCIRILSVRDNEAEPTGLIFHTSGTEAYVNIQHRSTGQGALLKISGFKIKKHE